MEQPKSEYEITAEEFCTRAKILFSTTFDGHRKYFPEDKESRDVYICTFLRGTRTLSITFGQSIIHSKIGNESIKRMEARGNYKRMKIKSPTAYDVLSCIQKTSPGTFEQFCSEHGYDSDSRQAEKTWKLCVEQWFQVEQFFTAKEIEEIQEIN